MIEQKKLSRRTLLKGLFAAPLVIPFQADAQTIYKAITTEWGDDSAARELLVTSDIFSYSQPSHAVEAFGDFYTQFMALDTVLKDIRQRERLLPVGNKKVQWEKWAVSSQEVYGYYQNTTTAYPNRTQKELLSMVHQSSGRLGQYVRMAASQGKPRALAHNLNGCVFFNQPSYRQGGRNVAPQFNQVGNNDGFHNASLFGSLGFVVTQTLFHLGTRWLNNLLNDWRSNGNKPVWNEPVWKDTENVWLKEKNSWLYRDKNPAIWYDTTQKVERVSLSSEENSRLGLPGGYSHKTKDRGRNTIINIYWYPSDKERTWMGESRSQWNYDRQNRPHVVPLGQPVSNPFNFQVYRDSREKLLAGFFGPL